MAEAEIIPLETEKQKAERYKIEVAEALRPVLALMDEAKKDGLLIEFQLGIDSYGRAAVSNAAVVKRY
jgi:hypothetical protein